MINIGLQLYTIRDECEKDFIGAIKKVASIGYKGLEFAGYYGMDAKELRKIIDDLGVKAVNAHVALASMEKDLDSEIEYAKTLGMKTITVPWLPPEDRKDKDAFLRVSESVFALDEKCLKNEIQLCYHNHDFEFKKIDNEYVLDIFMKNAKNLKLELDTFWSSYAGINTVEYMNKYSSRLQYIHLKDMSKDAKSILESKEKDTPVYTLPVFAEVGEGYLDIKSFIKTAVGLGVEWAFVEQDICKSSSIESVKKSFDNLTKMGVVK